MARAEKETPRTIRELLQVSTTWLQDRGVESARLDAELLLAHALGESRLRLYMDMDRPLAPEELDRFRPLLARRGRREPVAYIVGEREFYGLAIEVTPAVLVPRPETEALVDAALERLPKDAEGTVLDVCTGSGCIAVAIAHHRPDVRVVAIDVSKEALEVAARNVQRHGLQDRITLVKGDLLEPLAGVEGARLVIGNPPYIRPEDREGLMPEVRDHEPAVALFGEGDDALGHHARVLRQARPLLQAGGAVILEAGYDQEEALLRLPHEGFSAPEILRDLGGRVRGAVWMRA